MSKATTTDGPLTVHRTGNGNVDFRASHNGYTAIGQWNPTTKTGTARLRDTTNKEPDQAATCSSESEVKNMTLHFYRVSLTK